MSAGSPDHNSISDCGVQQMLKEREHYSYDTSTCFACSGFYGPCFSDPLCATCHAFLFPADWSQLRTSTIINPTADDNDSGNDEPNDPVGAQPSGSSQQAGEGPPCAPDIAYRISLLSEPQSEASYSSLPVRSLPPEIILLIFSMLDDLSLWSCSQVCSDWKTLILSNTSEDLWQAGVSSRFPLFKPLSRVNNWFHVYSQLMDSCSCYNCLNQVSTRIAPRGKETSWRRNRLCQEIRSMRQDPPQGISAMPLDKDNCYWQALISGPVGSPYEGGLFYLHLLVPYSYPMDPPQVRFITKIFHPNICRHGDVGIDSIKHNWSLALTITKVLVSIQSLLTDPYCLVCMEPSVGLLYTDHRDVFVRIAQAWTWRYAMSDVFTSPTLNSSKVQSLPPHLNGGKECTVCLPVVKVKRK